MALKDDVLEAAGVCACGHEGIDHIDLSDWASHADTCGGGFNCGCCEYVDRGLWPNLWGDPDEDGYW